MVLHVFVPRSSNVIEAEKLKSSNRPKIEILLIIAHSASKMAKQNKIGLRLRERARLCASR